MTPRLSNSDQYFTRSQAPPGNEVDSPALPAACEAEFRGTVRYEADLVTSSMVMSGVID